MSRASIDELTKYFIQFYQKYYHEEIGTLAQNYPTEQRSLYIDYDDLYQFNSDLADDYLAQPKQITEYAEEALRLYDLPGDVKLGHAYVRLQGLPNTVESIRPHQAGRLVAVEGIITQAKDEAISIVDAAFECQRCGTMNYIPQEGGEYQEPHDCQGCERKGAFKINHDQSEFIDTQEFTIESTSSDLSDGTKTLEINVRIEDDLVGVPSGDCVTVTGIVCIEQESETSRSFEPYLEGVSIVSADDTSPTFDSHTHEEMGMEEYLSVAPNILAGLPDTALEPGTKAKLITPFIEALGWNKFDNDEWRFEYTDDKTEKRVDYALFGEDSESPAVVIEAKRIGKGLDKGEPQIYDYLRIFSADYGLVTNGEAYRVYRNRPEEEPERIAEIELHDVANAGILDELCPSAFIDTSSIEEESRVTIPTDDRGHSKEDLKTRDEPDDADVDLVLDAIDYLEDDYENGIPVSAVVTETNKMGMGESTATAIIDSLAMNGKIYYSSESQVKAI